MNDKLEKLSALYDGEVSDNEFNEALDDLKLNSHSKDIFKQFALISEVMQRKSLENKSKLSNIFSITSKINPIFTNVLTAAATVLITTFTLYQIDDDRFAVSKESTLQLSSALSSDEAKNQLINSDQNIVEHMIHIMQSNQPHDSDMVLADWIPVGFQPVKNKPHQFTNGQNNLYLHIENKQLGIKKVKYYKANQNWIYLIPLKDGRLLTAYGDVPPEIAKRMIYSINNKK